MDDRPDGGDPDEPCPPLCGGPRRTGEDRRAGARPGGLPGRRWHDDPDIKASFDHLAVRLSRDLNTLRERQGWSIDALSKVAGVHPATILALEQTRTDPQLSTLVRLLYPFGYQLQIGLRPTVQMDGPGYNRVNPPDPTHN